MSRRGNCYDNAQAESFWSRLKTELLDGGRFPGLEEALLELSRDLRAATTETVTDHGTRVLTERSRGLLHAAARIDALLDDHA